MIFYFPGSIDNILLLKEYISP